METVVDLVLRGHRLRSCGVLGFLGVLDTDAEVIALEVRLTRHERSESYLMAGELGMDRVGGQGVLW